LRISSLPVAVEPVKDSLRTCGWASSASPTSAACSRGVGSTEITPPGSPARSASAASARADSGVSSAGLSTTVQPAARAGAHLRVTIALGKFQGVTATTTHTGCR
jgi:hypothetical protein